MRASSFRHGLRCALVAAALGCAPVDPLPPITPAQGSAPGGPSEDPALRRGKVEIPKPPPGREHTEPVPKLTRQDPAAWVEPLRRMLSTGDVEQLARWAHPTKGIRFSPYAFVGDDDLTLSRAEILAAAKSNATRRWGSYDGSGEPIELSFSDYFERFVRIPKAATAKSAIDRVIGSGNTKNNLREVYPGLHFVELHSPGVDPKYEGMDWQSVRFVLESDGRATWIVAVVHDQWTI